MDMSGMSMGGGMDMSSEGPFRPTNMKIARGYWYAIAGVVGTLVLVRVVGTLESNKRRRSRQKNQNFVPPRPQDYASQLVATATATLRELAYPQPVYFTGRFSRYFTPLPVGRFLLLVLYWIMLLCFLWTNTILAPSNSMYAYKWEIVGFRAAWVSVSQVPFIYLLSAKFNPISLLTGISYERFNWLHRWAARTLFLTVIVHWSFFFREWWLADFVTLEINMMPMVKYGFGAWSVVGWMVLSGFGFFRNLSYEIWVAQHICAAATLLWLLHTHVPQYAKYNIYMAIGFVAFDWGARILWTLLRNTHAFARFSSKTPGYRTHFEKLPGDMVRAVIENVDFTWRAGQHVYVSIPRLRPFEFHPFTIANASHTDCDTQRRQLTLVVKAHSGFSRSLLKASMKSDRSFRTFLSGPWGMPPDLRSYDTIVFIACASGASFTVPILQELTKSRPCARSVAFHWIIRSDEHFCWVEKDLTALVRDAENYSFRLRVSVHVTASDATSRKPEGKEETKGDHSVGVSEYGLQSEDALSSDSVISSNEKTPLSTGQSYLDRSRASSLVILHDGRPNVESLIRPGVEAATGETAVVVCGGLSISAQVRNCVAALSDERAVHKGTGAQGIFLFTETYGW